MIGQTISHYRIVEKLGEGGMGVVYIAEDTVLGRRVAIKTLHADRNSQNSHFRIRFLREARAVSALSHPHIATIHDYGETEDGQPYIVMELVKGETLGDLMQKDALTIPRAIEIISQIAEALAEAHSHGIVHRDIKPSNVAINERGNVKVLDFGLAKQIEVASVNASNIERQTLLNTQTKEGVIVGTPMYLSPEQAMGIDVDARSDLFSLGSLLYECIAGKPPFSAGSPVEICAQIMRDDPPRPSEFNSKVSSELDRVTLKALAKKPEQRYQTAEELIADLHSVVIFADGSYEHKIRLSTQGTDQVSARSPVDAITTSHRRTLLFLMALILLGSMVGLYTVVIRPRSAATTPRLEFTRLAFTGSIKEASISSDGRYIATIVDENDQRSLWLRQINTSSNLQIVTPSGGQYRGLSFSPDGDYVYYLYSEDHTGVLYRVSVLGGEPRRLLPNVDSPVTFSPDGKRMAFVRQYPQESSNALIIADSDGDKDERLLTLTLPKSFALNAPYSSGPAWSPDGKVIACIALNMTDASPVEVLGVSTVDGSAKPISSQRWSLIGKLVWLSDGSGLIMNARTEKTLPLQLWFLSYGNGEAHKVTEDPNSYVGLSATKDASTLLTMKVDKPSNIWVMSEKQTTNAIQIRSSKYAGSAGLSWTPDGRIVYASNEAGGYNIWIMNSDGGHPRQLTFDNQTNIEPTVSPDGRYIVFYREAEQHLWIMEIDGSNLRPLTNGRYEDTPQFSPRGNWIVYRSIEPDGIWRLSINDGSPLLLAKEPSVWPDVSPDGKVIASISLEQTGKSPWKITVIPSEGGPPTKTFPLPASFNPSWPGIRWGSDGLSVIYVATSDGVSNIWSQPLSGGSPRQVTDFKEDQIFSFALSVRTGQLACVRGFVSKELFLVRRFS